LVSIHRTVFAAEDNTRPGFFAVKFHREERPFERECGVYQRLREEQTTRILGFNVPKLLSIDAEFRAIEMTIVRPPFLLDFADALLDEAPDFSEDVLRQWEEERAEIFGERWPEVTRILAALQAFDVYLLDINPRNISFPEETRVKQKLRVCPYRLNPIQSARCNQVKPCRWLPK
jgi:hypothetical protein